MSEQTEAASVACSECGHTAPHTWDYGCNEQVNAHALCPCRIGMGYGTPVTQGDPARFDPDNPARFAKPTRRRVRLTQEADDA